MRALFRLLSLVGGPALAGCLAAAEVPAQASGDVAAASLHIDDASVPDPSISPGDVSPDLSAADLCDMPIEKFAAVPPKALCDDAFEDAHISTDHRFQYACVFLVPPAIGGTQSHANIWLQAAAEAPLKASADAAARKQICKNPDDLVEAQRLLAIDWVGAYRKYLLPADKLAPDRRTEHFGVRPPVSAQMGGGAAAGGAAACGNDMAYGSGDGGGDGGGADPSDRQRRQQRSLRDDRSFLDGRGEDAWRGNDRRAHDAQAPWPRDRDSRRHDEAGRSPDGRGIHSYDGARGPRNGRDTALPGDGRDGDRRSIGPREIDAHRSVVDERGSDSLHRQPTVAPQHPDERGSGPDHQYGNDDRRVLRPRYANARDLRSSDHRPGESRPNDVRPSLPGLVRRRYRGPMRHGVDRRGAHRR